MTILYTFVFIFTLTLFTFLGVATFASIIEAILHTDKYIRRGEEVAPIFAPFIAWGRLIKGLFKKKRY